MTAVKIYDLDIMNPVAVKALFETERPDNIYAATKACQNMLAGIYARAYGMQLIMVRAYGLLI